jgi:hypothetical protein
MAGRDGRGAGPAGDSKIELTLGGCVIQKNWKSAGRAGYEGKSYHTYNPDLHRWEQVWNRSYYIFIDLF